MSNKLILASGSPRRHEIVESLAVPYEVVVARVDEHEGEGLGAEALALHNAELKAEAVATDFPGNWVLGADTVVALGGKIYGKPENLEEAKFMLSQLSGKEHSVYTGVTLIHREKGARIDHCELSKVKFMNLSEAEIEHFVANTNPLDKAGGYGIQYCEREHCVVESYTGSYWNIVGLPKEYLKSVFQEIGLLDRD